MYKPHLNNLFRFYNYRTNFHFLIGHLTHWISVRWFVELINFWHDPKCSRLRTFSRKYFSVSLENNVLSQFHIYFHRYFCFFFQIYIHNFRLKLIFIKGELHSNYIFRYFALIGLEWDSLNLFTKMNFFFSKTHISAPFTQDIYMTFYLLTWTYFNDVNGDRNILINSQLKRILFMSSDKKKWSKTEKGRKNMEKENNINESETRIKFFEAFWISAKNKHRRY